MIRRAQTPEHQLAPVLRAWRQHRFDMVLSTHILTELHRTLSSPYFARLLSDRDRITAIDGFHEFATITDLTVAVEGVATHPEDDLILATAVSGQADYLVTLDRQLLTLSEFQGVKIVSPQAFLAVLAAEA